MADTANIVTTPTCLDVDARPGRRAHTWEGRGLDIIKGTLCTTRHCVRCDRREHKTYGAGGRRGWAVTS